MAVTTHPRNGFLPGAAYLNHDRSIKPRRFYRHSCIEAFSKICTLSHHWDFHPLNLASHVRFRDVHCGGRA